MGRPLTEHKYLFSRGDQKQLTEDALTLEIENSREQEKLAFAATKSDEEKSLFRSALRSAPTGHLANELLLLRQVHDLADALALSALAIRTRVCRHRHRPSAGQGDLPLCASPAAKRPAVGTVDPLPNP